MSLYGICLYLTSLSMIIFRPIHVAANGIISFFFPQVVVPCLYMPHLLYPLLCWWTVRLFPRRDSAAVTIVVTATFWKGHSLFRLSFCPDNAQEWICRMIGFPGGSDGKASACSAGHPGSIPGLGRSPGEGHGNQLQYSCLENSMDWEAPQSLVGYSPGGHKESDTTERLHFTSHGSCTFIFLYCSP